MTTPTLDAPLLTPEAVAAASPGSRALRMSIPRTIDVLRQLAIEHGVCVRPQPFRVTDPATGAVKMVDLSCKVTRTALCPSCAAKAKLLRQVQCRQGWHRTDEPVTPQSPTEEQRDLVARRGVLEFLAAQAEQLGQWQAADLLYAEMADLEAQITLSGLRGLVGNKDGKAPDGKRRVRSTKRRQDVPNLPRKKVAARTVGQVYIGRDGKKHQPSSALTLTLDSYGRVRRSDSTPVDMNTYDYQRAAKDAVHFPKLLDRFWQNLRRAIGWNVQYFGCVEPQRRLAPHAHYAARGTFPRRVFWDVVAGTYHQVWWPSTNTVIFAEDGPQPQWVDERDGAPVAGYISPFTGQLLPTWEQAMDALDALRDEGTAVPEHVIRFGKQAYEDVFDDRQAGTQHGEDQDEEDEDAPRRMGMQGMEGGTAKAEKMIGYLTKYITKSVDECHQRTTARQIEHHHRFYEALRFTPCSSRCANWLRYGIQPENAREGMLAGRCRGRVHQPSTLGIGGRRILVSRDWSGKTLADHKADQATWVRLILEAGLEQQPTSQDLGNHGEDQGEGGDPGDELHPEYDDCEGADNDWRDWTDEAETNPDGQSVLSLQLGNQAKTGQAQGPAGLVWERLKPGDEGVTPLHVRLWRNLGERIRRRTEWQTAQANLTAGSRPPEPGDVSAITSTEGGEAA